MERTLKQNIKTGHQVFQDILNGDRDGNRHYANPCYGYADRDLPQGENPENDEGKDDEIEDTTNERANIDVDTILAQAANSQRLDCACYADTQTDEQQGPDEILYEVSDIASLQLAAYTLPVGKEQVGIPDQRCSSACQNKWREDNRHP